MSDPENKNSRKGFKGLQSLGSKSAESPAPAERKLDPPELPPAWQEYAPQQTVQPRPTQSQTAAPPWRGWLIGLGILGAVILLIVWAGNQPSSSNSYSPPTATDYSSTAPEPAPAAETPAGPTVTMPPVGDGLVLTSDQIRYCVYEDRRIKGAEKVVNNGDQTSVSTFNAMVDDYNGRCSHFQYRQGALTPIETEADQIQGLLEQEGRARMIPAQTYDPAAAAAGAAADAAAQSTSASETVAAELAQSQPQSTYSSTEPASVDNQHAIPEPAENRTAAPSQDAYGAPPYQQQADGSPAFSEKAPYGSGWVCLKGYAKAGDSCIPVDVPVNGVLDYTGHDWTCMRGFYQAGRECLSVEIPDNAIIDYTGHGWTCNRGYLQAGSRCLLVQLPDNGMLDYTGHDWTCNRGFYKAGNQCLAVDIPLNGALDYTGHEWTCNRGYYKAGGQCAAVAVPSNASLDYTGHDWTCDRGFVRSGNQCQLQ